MLFPVSPYLTHCVCVQRVTHPQPFLYTRLRGDFFLSSRFLLFIIQTAPFICICVNTHQPHNISLTILTSENSQELPASAVKLHTRLLNQPVDKIARSANCLTFNKCKSFNSDVKIMRSIFQIFCWFSRNARPFRFINESEGGRLIDK